jgi:hypothetical protein
MNGWGAVDMHGASAAQRHAATKLRTGHAEHVAQHPQEWRIAIDIDITRVPVDFDAKGHGVISSFYASNRFAQRSSALWPPRRNYAHNDRPSMGRRSDLIGGGCLKCASSAQDAGEEDALELRDRGSVPPSLREKDRSLQRRQDEVADFLALEVLRKLAGLDRRLQAGRE